MGVTRYWMMKIWPVFYLFFISLLAQEDIGGFWKSLKDDGSPQCIFGVYEYDGTYYGRIIGTYNDEGKMLDTIYKPIGKAAGIVDTPHTCGLDIVYGLTLNAWRYVGKIVDPTKGNIYNCEVWAQDGNLIVRGKVLMFGKNITWYPAKPEDFPKGFKLPDMSTFVPKVPQVN